jgi:[acyl-carrier-protein] S-malonyltransferase
MDNAIIFPGQGAQEVGMGKSLFENSESAKDIFLRADEALGFSLSKIIFEGPSEELERTINTQPAILTMSIACFEAYKSMHSLEVSEIARFCAGHSLGEYSALVASQAISLEDGVKLVRERGRLMQEACDRVDSGMAAIIGLEEDAVQEICIESNTQAANINSPGQIVISGLKSDIDNAVKIASDRGAKRAIPLKVSGAFHSYLMSSALSEMNEAIKNVTFNNSSIPLIANCSSKPMSNVSEIREELSEQLCGCVYWQRGIEHMANEGITTFYEFGPGKVLSGMVKRISENSITHSVSDYESLINLQPEN